jgi:hypothetical protein
MQVTSFKVAAGDESSDDRIVSTWGESWVLKAAPKVETIPDRQFWLEHPWALLDAIKLDEEMKKYKLVDTDGQPFADAGLSEREDNRQLGANNFWLAPHCIKQLAHLGWVYAPHSTMTTRRFRRSLASSSASVFSTRWRPLPLLR